MVAASCAQRVGKVYDQYLSFIALEAGLFSLGLRDTYLQLNDPAARDTQIAVRPAAVYVDQWGGGGPATVPRFCQVILW